MTGSGALRRRFRLFPTYARRTPLLERIVRRSASPHRQHGSRDQQHGKSRHRRQRGPEGGKVGDISHHHRSERAADVAAGGQQREHRRPAAGQASRRVGKHARPHQRHGETGQRAGGQRDVSAVRQSGDRIADYAQTAAQRNGLQRPRLAPCERIGKPSRAHKQREHARPSRSPSSLVVPSAASAK